jgi:cytochrome c oxidase cbb3-type subunit 2
MNPGPLLFLGTFFALATSWFTFVLAPQLQIGGQQPVELASTGQPYPSRPSGTARQGEQVYRANGCYYCHSQQVRPKGFGNDIARGWGARPSLVQSVAADYLYDQPAMLGSQRIGPDLTNVGLRQPDASWHFKHLYNPQLVSPGSTMPPYRFLFERRDLKFGEKPSKEAVDGGTGYEILPGENAKALVAYLMNLHSEAMLFETPPLTKPTASVASTNAPVATTTNSVPTNAPAK